MSGQGSRNADLFPAARILGSRIHMVQIPDVVAVIEQWIHARGARCRHVVVSGMHGIIEGHKDQGFKAILNSADLFAPDGISAVWIARLRGFGLEKRVTGTDLMKEFFRLANQKGYGSFFYGDTEETLGLLAARVRRDFPGHRIVGTFSPPFRPLTPQEDEQAVRTINDARPDVLWVGLGLPKQERWIFEHREKLDVPVAVGVGAAFRFLSGQVTRAPAWMGESGLEWLWRLVHEPRRVWRRVLFDGPRFLFHVALELSGIRKYD